jgi:hypothetical protein
MEEKGCEPAPDEAEYENHGDECALCHGLKREIPGYCVIEPSGLCGHTSAGDTVSSFRMSVPENEQGQYDAPLKKYRAETPFHEWIE